MLLITANQLFKNQFKLEDSLLQRSLRTLESTTAKAYDLNDDLLIDLQEEAREELLLPMRIAIVGSIKTGKSTLMNAILGEDIVPTATKVLTYNVNWFHYSSKPYLVINYKQDGRKEKRPFSELATLVKVCEEKKEFLDSIWWIDVYYPHPILQKFDLIDTPGLDSVLKDDSSKTRELLVSPKNRPHALIFLVRKEFLGKDIEDISNFNTKFGSLMSGITALCGFSRIDELASRNFREVAEDIIDLNITRHPEIRRSFYKIMPISAKLYLASKLLDTNDMVFFRSIASQTEERVLKYIKSPKYIKGKDANDEAFVNTKKAILDKIGLKGVSLILELLQENKSVSITAIKSHLALLSRVDFFLETVSKHFGNRATLIKVKLYFDRIHELIQRQSRNYFGDDKRLLSDLAFEIDAFRANNHAFKEYKVLENYYGGKLDLRKDEQQWMLEITGENGNSLSSKLGMDDKATVAEMLEQAQRRESYWKNIAYERFRGIDVNEAARVLYQSNTNILTVLNKMKKKDGRES